MNAFIRKERFPVTALLDQVVKRRTIAAAWNILVREIDIETRMTYAEFADAVEKQLVNDDGRRELGESV